VVGVVLEAGEGEATRGNTVCCLATYFFQPKATTIPQRKKTTNISPYVRTFFNIDSIYCIGKIGIIFRKICPWIEALSCDNG
jgi:hypothetical protein